MFDSLVAWAGEVVFWVVLGVHLPQPPWAKWVQEKVVDGYYWAKDKIKNR